MKSKNQKSVYTCLIFLILSSCVKDPNQKIVYEDIITLPEKWVIKDKNINISRTGILNHSIFVVHASIDHPLKNNVNDEKYAEDIAYYAIKNGYLKNALKYENYGKIKLNTDIIRIILKYDSEKEQDTETTMGYEFLIEELIDNAEEIIEYPLPETLTDSEKKRIKTEIIRICKTQDWNAFYNLYSEDALNDFNLEEGKNKIQEIYGLTEKITFLDSDFIVYVGTKNGVKGFQYFLPIRVVSKLNNKIELSAYITVLIIDVPTKYEIYQIDLNFPNDGTMQKFFGNKEI